MKRLVVTMLGIAAFASLASADVELMLVSGSSSVTVNSSGVIIAHTGSVTGTALLLSPGVIEFAGSVGGFSRLPGPDYSPVPPRAPRWP